jgi:dienelactone hydrolase
VPNPLSRAALLWLAPLFVSCAVGAGVPESEHMIGAAFADGGLADTGGTGGLALTGGAGALTGGIGGPVVPVLTGGLMGGGQTGGPGGSLAAPPTGARLPAKLPMPSGTCPEFASGEVMVTPAGEAARRVILWSAQGTGGPLVIYWHSTGATPAEASVALSGAIEEITGKGGVVAAPYPGANEGMYPWVSTTPAALKVADEIVACAIAKKGINPARIHTLGYSAGGLMSGSLAVQRSSYVASMAAYSGGQTATTRGMFEDPTNKLSGLLFHGGTMDTAGGTSYPTAANNYVMTLRGNGGAAVVCNHNMGRTMPSDGPLAVLRFFEDHPFGRPSPYAGGLPPGLPAYCMLQP